jgi:hypothetical protein
MRSKDEIPVLIAEIENELSKLYTIVNKIAGQKNRTDDEEVIESAALRLHNFYTGCERIFNLIAAEVNGATPHEPDWHKRLLNQVALDIDPIRPAIISQQTHSDLSELLRFRHIVRNIYGFELSPDRITHLIDHTMRLYPRFSNEIGAFLEFLKKIYQEA